jgi:hypothetical protein
MTLQSFVSEFLTFLEKREERLLSWGFYNVRWTVADIEGAFSSEAPVTLQEAWVAFANQGRTLDSLILQMRLRHLVYLVPDVTPVAYRTRFAEGVRLLANLRQIFKPDDWATGPRLVSDIKLQITPRQYPRRNLSADAVWESLRPKCPTAHVELMRQCFFALADRGGSPMDFAGFQLRAFEHILERYGSKGFSGSVVCAGTGSGKTKAFYVPAYLRMAPELNKPPFTKIIAIYPRNVLLADQLREAIAEAEKLRPVLKAVGLRPIRFGALLGDTPYQQYFTNEKLAKYGWKRSGNGAVIPYLKSPLDGGRSDLIWRDEDRKAGRTCLYREGESKPDVDSGVLAITREELANDPPDVLFLSLEMLNREMCNPHWEKTFGMGRGSDSPRLLLLDEVHAHEGLSGAQVAWVLRRWRHWARLSALHVVGLSATLRDAPQHLARVASISPSQVLEFRPVPGVEAVGEMVAEGAEYNLAVKGDPAAGTSLLGSSIQAGMLLARLLTPRTQGPSGDEVELRPEEFFRKKVFGFSDNLDSVNRWFSDMSDAESSNWRHPLLASLRQLPPGTSDPIRRRRIQEGQFWELPRLIGHNLDQPLVVTRCSSQDPGADSNSDLIIATSSLEVGFDDPDVGIMLHHKRPTSMSSFIQRKGRAGRTRGARPWTVVVLSDYGADRWAFHSAERLFQPEVDALVLPTLNPHVLRVQLAHYLIDWIGRRLGGTRSAYSYLQGPTSWPPDRGYQDRARELLRGLLDQGQVWKEFERELFRFFRAASALPEEDARDLLNNLLWHEPRPLLMQVVPTLLRKLEADWICLYPKGKAMREDKGAKRPLPQFIPKATFEDLEVGEAVLELEPYIIFKNNPPKLDVVKERDPETMSIARLLFEACPGRVSKRFANVKNEPGYWHSYSTSLTAGANFASVEQLFPHHTFLEAVNGVSALQPDAAPVVHRPKEINDTCNASWQWQTVARVQGDGEVLPVRETNPWRTVFSESRAYLHSNAEWIEMLRFSEENSFEMRRQTQSISGSLRLQKVLEGGAVERQAVGFRLRVDGVRFILSAVHLDSRPPVSGATLDRFRAEYFKHSIAVSPSLRGVVNSFQADWLAQMSLAMLTATALLQKVDLHRAQEELNGKRAEAANRVLDVIFQMRGVSAHGDEEDARLRTTLLDLWGNTIVQCEIIKLENVLWDVPDREFTAWVRKRYAASLAQALCAAMINLSPQVSEDDLVVDVLHRDDNGYDITITESSPGGLGQIETIIREMQRQPRRFLDGLEFALNHCPRERMATDLLEVARAAACEPGGAVAAAFDQARVASGFTELEEAKGQLQLALQSRGFTAKRSLVVAVATKLLRPATDVTSDRLVFRLNRSWRRRSEKLGIAVPMRTFAYTCARHSKVGPFIATYFEAIGGEAPTAPQLFAQMQQLLFETCEDSCPECLNQRGRFYDLGLPSRTLAREWLGIEIQSVSLDADPNDWPELARQMLRSKGRVRLVAGPTQRSALAGALPRFFVEEIDLESLRVPVSVARIEQAADKIAVVLHIPDFVNG